MNKPGNISGVTQIVKTQLENKSGKISDVIQIVKTQLGNPIQLL